MGNVIVSNITRTPVENGSNWGSVAGVTPTTAFFTDGFETGDLSHSENGAGWGSNVRFNVTGNSPKSGSYNGEFNYEANAEEADGFSELRYSLGGNYTEIWVGYDLYIPDNYYHREQSDSANNKGFLFAWSGDYGSPSGPGMGPNFWPLPDGSSGSTHYVWGIDFINQWGEPRTQIHLTEGVNTSGINLSDRGKWIKIICHYKYASSANNDGVAEIWKKYPDETIEKHIDIQNGAWYVSGQPGFDQGYILGWANSGFTDATTFKIDNVEFSETNIWGVV